MDGARFDALARGLARRGSRRSLVGALAGAAAALATRGGAGAACPPDQVERRGVCVCKTTRRQPIDGVCPCRRRETPCGDSCVDTDRDVANCGACGVACAANERCRFGVCEATEQCRVDGDCGTSNACVAFACVGGACVETATVCDDINPCTTSACDPAVGCVHTPVVCSNPTPICNSATGGCGPCLGTGDCPAGEECVGGECRCVGLDALACQGRECGTVVNNCGDTVNCGPQCLECQVCTEAGVCIGLSGGFETCGSQTGVCCGGTCFAPCRTGTACEPMAADCGFSCASCCTGYVQDMENGGFVCM